MEKANSILTVPLLSPAWKKVAFVFLPLPVNSSDRDGISSDGPLLQMNLLNIYGCGRMGLRMQNLTKGKKKKMRFDPNPFRLQASPKTGFYWLDLGTWGN